VISYQSGDLFGCGLPALAHGVNCAGAMGAGIAVEFKRRWPAMYHEYQQRCAARTLAPGEVFMWQDGPSPVIFNLATQVTWRTPATLQAVGVSVAAMLHLAEEHGLAKVGMPRVGAGLGRLKWDDVNWVLQAVAGEAPVQLVVYTLEGQ
jgi:O-acetyl-ADP-ribose deacetylase (regulator of RNase III)